MHSALEVLVCFLVLLRPWAYRLGGSAAEDSDQFTEADCDAVVQKVQASGKFTEESIVPICRAELKATKCDFFAEALSLATSHPEFNRTHFCYEMGEAHFCSRIMDKLLKSVPVSDLAYGECERARPAKGSKFCAKFKNMLAYAINDEDLDTIRACYMVESYTNLNNESETLEPSAKSPDSRIIAGGSNDIQSLGAGNATEPNNVGRSSIVVQPTPFETFGKGNGTVDPTAAKKTTAAEPPHPGSIITEPIPAMMQQRVGQSASPGHTAVRQQQQQQLRGTRADEAPGMAFMQTAVSKLAPWAAGRPQSRADDDDFRDLPLAKFVD